MARFNETISVVIPRSTGVPFGKIIAGVVVVFGLVFTLLLGGKFVENVDAGEIMVVQDVADGQLHFYKDAGIKPQWFGRVTKYQKRDTYDFTAPVMFNDAGGGTIHGSIQFELPLDEKNLKQLHTKYGSQEAIKEQVIKRTVDKVINL